VNWTDNSNNESGFKVYVSTTPNADCSLATYPGSPDYTTAANAVSQAVTGKSINSQYCAKAVATNTDGDDSTAAYSSPAYTLANVPGAPTVSANWSSGNGYYEDVTVNVNNNPAGTNYWIQYSTDNNTFSDPAGMAWQTGTAYTLTNLSANTQYWFKVKAKNGDSVATAYSSSGADVTPPAAPTGLNSSNLCRTTASTSWVASAGADKYTLSYGTDSGGTNLGTIGNIAVTNQNLSSLANNTQYYFKVSATSNANGTGAYSSTASFSTGSCTAPIAPSDFAGSAASTSQINWTWTDTADDETGWKVEDSSHTNLSGALAANSTSWNETGLSVNTAYTRIANVYNASGNNDSNQATVYTLSNVPSAPTVSAVATGINIVVNKNSNPDANTRYAIYNQTAGQYVKHADGTLQSSPDWQLYADWGGTNGFVNTGLTSNASYSYQVKAENGNSVATAYSSSASATTPPAAPTTSGTSGICRTVGTVAWGAVSGADSYTISYGTDSGATNLGTITGITATSKQLTTLSNNVIYYWKIESVSNANGTGAYSTVANFLTAPCTPTAPSGATIGTLTTTGFTTTWTDNSNNESGFKVYVSTTANADCSLATYPGSPDYTTAANATSQAVTGKSINSQYCAKVTATNTDGDDSTAAYSSPAYTLSNVPSAPTATKSASTAIRVTINTNSNPSGTHFAIKETNSGKFVRQSDGTLQTNADWQTYTVWGGASGINVNGLTANTQYKFAVDAANEAAMRFDGNGNPLNQITAFSAETAETTYPTYTVTIATAGNGSGTLDQSTQAVNWGSNLTVNANPAASSNFTGWSGDASGTGAATLTNITANKTLTATFTLNIYTITIGTAGNGTGSLDQSTQSVNYGSSLTVNATPNISSDFTGWSGDASGTGAAVLTNITANKSITATFTLKMFTVVVGSAGTGTGTFDQGTQTVNYGSDFTTTATAGSGSVFVSFAGCDSTSGPGGSTCHLTNIAAGKTVTATFALTPIGTISINSGATKTNQSSVNLALTTNTATDMKISNLSNLSDASYQSFATTSNGWALASPTVDGTKTVYLKVRDQYGKESPVYSSSIILDTTPTGPGTNLVANAGNTSISLSWTNPTDSDLYKVAIFRSTDANFTPQLGVNKIGNTDNAQAQIYVDSTVQNNVTYYYKVEAVDDADNYSTESNITSGKPDSDNPTTPGKPSVSETTVLVDGKIVAPEKKLTFNWNPSVDINSGVAGYYLTIGKSSGANDVLDAKQIDAATTSYQQEFASDGEYFVRVLAKDNKGNSSAYSDEYVIYVDTTAPSDPSDVLMYDVSDRSNGVYGAMVAWKSSTDDVAGVKGYVVSRGGTGLDLNSDQVTGSVVTDDKSGYSFYLDLQNADATASYSIKAVDKAGNTNSAVDAKLANTDLTTTTGQKAGASEIKLPASIIGEGKLTLTDVAVAPSGVVSDKTQAQVTWKTGVPATSQVEYGISTSYNLKTDPDSGLNSSHTVILSDLNPATTYHFKVDSKDKNGNSISSNDQTFSTGNQVKSKSVLDIISQTLSDAFLRTWNSISGFFTGHASAADNSSATINNISVINISTPDKPGFAIYWPKNKGTVTVERSDGSGATAVGSTDQNFFIDFSAKSDGNYTYKVAGLSGTVADELSGKSTISDVKIDSGAVSKDQASVIVTFKTDKLAQSQISYGEGSSLSSQTTLDDSLNQSHTVLIEKLKPKTAYSFSLKAIDKSGAQTTESSTQTYVTPSAPQDQSLLEIIVNALQGAFAGFEQWMRK
jgi:hypothetical protein